MRCTSHLLGLLSNIRVVSLPSSSSSFRAQHSDEAATATTTTKHVIALAAGTARYSTAVGGIRSATATASTTTVQCRHAAAPATAAAASPSTAVTSATFRPAAASLVESERQRFEQHDAPDMVQPTAGQCGTPEQRWADGGEQYERPASGPAGSTDQAAANAHRADTPVRNESHGPAWGKCAKGSHSSINIQRHCNASFLLRQVLLQQQQVQIDEALNRAQEEMLIAQSQEYNLPLHEFDSKLQPIIDSCTKDSISNGKFAAFAVSLYVFLSVDIRNKQQKNSKQTNELLPLFT